ncbi:hypothetical protein C8A03DRAFT_36602 [Achaetomium macrosporum]|uniref:AGC-kinase C-terminal domain-containing protein n=1 Tax=Achaetomium macrosporum TaxID=79813 RepID=A0AAN7C5C4_9PEZI|nr:hypothetical protein C8A03DRAFT_36602 [Achaetomium macrosporum]
MLSHLRLHRRAPSNPTSPLPDQSPACDTAAQREQPQSARDVAPRSDARPRSPNSSQMPPVLPPIARVASTGSDHSFPQRDDAPPSSHDPGKDPARRAYDEDTNSGFIGGVALQNYRKAVQQSQSSHAAAAMANPLPESQLSRAKPPPSPIDTASGYAVRPALAGNKQTKSSWFSAQIEAQASGGTAGKRPSGTRLATVPTANVASEPQKAKKGLPFLKNPMSSLLMRRKTAQTVAEAQLPPPSYDPRIKGTRVHDFSAPRPKKAIPSNDVAATAKPEAAPTVDSSVEGGEKTVVPLPAVPLPLGPAEPFSSEIGAAGDEKQGGQESKALSLDGSSPERSAPQVPPKDESSSSLHTSSSAASRATQVGPLPALASVSMRSAASRQLSVSEVSRRGSSASAVPRHMKSTSSRFSFDMIGAAKQERLLEERHRLREQERKMSDDPGDRDARFDDFDDDFDYDAMMDDDGLEERIPGINADYDDEEDLGAAMDPDNDQENFAGFTFQRSNPASSLVSPHTPAMVPTPRDANGQTIGFAMIKDTTPELPTADSPMCPNPLRLSKQDISGLGIQGLETGATNGAPESVVFRPSQPPPQADDFLFIDDGLADELDFEHDGTAFDESIFDINDTDQFGRPIPGAFAQAKEAMQTAKQQQQQQQQQPSKRDSDMTSSASAQSGVAHSTGHTSPSAGLQQPPEHQESADHSSSKPDHPEAMTMMDMPAQDLAYQAALAEAAQKAAASGKFRRSSSPDVLAGLADTPLNDTAESYLNDYDDNTFTNDFDDFDFDDEAIIAEANASALANDSDGFYGQEFGFYSAPIPQHQPYYSNHHQSSASSPGGVQTTESVFQYANGGYFGPTGAAFGRSASGRVVCREPNLTPITERSEYSNRNSVMSFTLPPAITSEGGGGGGGAGARNSASAMTSPGLAQLANLMSDDAAAADSMTLSALMKLRSKAWGGSQASLVSSSREGSPRSDGGGAGSPYGTVPAHLAGHVRVNSGLSLWSCSEAAEEQEQEQQQGGSGAASPAMGPLPHPPPLAVGMGSVGSMGTSFPGIPPRPGSAGAVLNGPGGAGSTLNGVASPLPQRPHSLFLPPQAPLQIPSPGQGQQQMGWGPCSPVLEGEEAEAEEGGGGVGGGDKFALAPALPLRTRSSEGS